MKNNFSMELKKARRNAGLTQSDCGHLLGGSIRKITQLEHGERHPTLHEICTLSLIHGRNFENLFQDIFAQVRTDLSKHLESLPPNEAEHANTFNRKNTLEALAERLAEETGPHYGV